MWSLPHEWERRRRADGCIICVSGAPLDIVAEFDSCWATVPRVAPLEGYVCVVAKQHVNEPFEMDPQAQSQFWRDTMAIAAAVDGCVKPIKMNYEIHGNTLPHLHVHLFPRQPDDPFVGGPVDPRAVVLHRSDEQIERLSEAIRAASGHGR